MSFNFLWKRFLAQYVKPIWEYPFLWFLGTKFRIELLWADVVYLMFPVRKAISSWYKIVSVRRGSTLLPLPFWALIAITLIQGVASMFILGRSTFKNLLKNDFDFRNSSASVSKTGEKLLGTKFEEQGRCLKLEGNDLITYILLNWAWNDISDETNKIGQILISDNERLEERTNQLYNLLLHEDKRYSAQHDKDQLKKLIRSLVEIPAAKMLEAYNIDHRDVNMVASHPSSSSLNAEPQVITVHRAATNPSIYRLHTIVSVDPRNPNSKNDNCVNLLMVDTLDEKGNAADATFLYQVASNAHNIKNYVRHRCRTMRLQEKEALCEQLKNIVDAIGNRTFEPAQLSQNDFPFWHKLSFQAILHDFLSRHPETCIKKYYLENTLKVIYEEFRQECELKFENSRALEQARKKRMQAERGWLDSVKDLVVSSARLEQTLFKHRADIGKNKLYTSDELLEQELNRLKKIYHPDSHNALKDILNESVHASGYERTTFENIANIMLQQQERGVGPGIREDLPDDDEGGDVARLVPLHSENTDIRVLEAKEIQEKNRCIEKAFEVELDARYHNNDGIYGKQEARANKFGRICMWANLVIFAFLGIASSAIFPWPIVVLSTLLSIFSSYAWAGPDIISGIRSIGQACDQGWYMQKKRMQSKVYSFKRSTVVLLSVVVSLITTGLLFYAGREIMVSLMHLPVIRWIPQIIGGLLKLCLIHGTPFMFAYYFASILTICFLILATIGSFVLTFRKMSKSVDKILSKEFYQKFKESQHKPLLIGIAIFGLLLAVVSAYIGAEGDRSGLLKAFAWMGNPVAFAFGMTSFIVGIFFYLYESVEGTNDSFMLAKKVIKRLWNGKEPDPRIIPSLENLVPQSLLTIQTQGASTVSPVDSHHYLNGGVEGVSRDAQGTFAKMLSGMGGAQLDLDVDDRGGIAYTLGGSTGGPPSIAESPAPRVSHPTSPRSAATPLEPIHPLPSVSDNRWTDTIRIS